MTPTEFRSLARPQIRKLARQSKLVDTAFQVFCDAVFPGAPPNQRGALQAAFFAGAQELHTLQIMATDSGEFATDGDLELYCQMAAEIQEFHQRTMQAMLARVGKPN